MEHPRGARISDPNLVEEIREQHGSCIVGQYGEYGGCSDPGIDMHHIHTRGSGGGDVRGNLIRLCRQHHNMAHNGLISRATLKDYLLRRITVPALWYLGGEKAE